MKTSIAPCVLKLTLVALFVLSGCGDPGLDEGGPEIAVTNSYLQSVVEDLCGPETEVLCLAPPGMCPGHFDISPASIAQLRNCQVLVLFDFQEKVEATLARLKDNGLKTFRVTNTAGLCVPEIYLGACRQVAQFLWAEHPEQADDIRASLAAIERRMDRLSRELQDAVQGSGAAAAPVLVSHHQAAFAQWLGLETVATFVGSDTETIGGIDHCLKKAAGSEVRFVIANQQEGTALANALAQRLEADAVVFSNFPLQSQQDHGFDALLRDNVAHLLEAAR